MQQHSNYYYNYMQDNYDARTQRDASWFLRKYEAQASLSSHKMYAVREPYRFSSSYDVNSIPDTFSVKKEPYVEMYIPQDKFKELVETETVIQKLEEDVRYYKKIVEMHRNDERVRDNHPVVKKAWQKYLTLLELVRK